MVKKKKININTIILILIVGALAFLFLFQMNWLTPGRASENHRFREGLEKINKGEYNSAEILFEGLIKENPKDLDYKNSLGFIYARTGRREKAINEFKEIIQINENYDKAYANLGAIYESFALEYEDEGKISKAIDFYEMAKAQYETAIKLFGRYDKTYAGYLRNVNKKLESISSK